MGKHCVFGEIVEGHATLDAIEGVKTTSDDKPIAPVVIARCGQLERRVIGVRKVKKAKQSSSSSDSESSSSSSSTSSSSSSSSKKKRKKKKKNKNKKSKGREADKKTLKSVK